MFRESYGSDCGLQPYHWHVHDNRVYGKPRGGGAPGLRVCGMDFAQWQRLGHDPGTSVHAWPADAALVRMGKAALGWGSANITDG